MPICISRKANGQPCTREAAHDSTRCKRHTGVEQRRRQRYAADLVWIEISNQIWTNNTLVPDPLIAIVNTAFEHGDITVEWQARLIAEVYEELAFANLLDIQRRGNDTRPELQRLANDTQNVHTAAVTAQTNKTEKMLLEIPVAVDPTTLTEIQSHVNKRVFRDIEKWYLITTCRKLNDNLYKRMLDGLWARIQTSEHKVELIKRLIEETTESVGKCCEGHLSRLCNVLVGFDDEAQLSVSANEILQNKMSVIAAKDVPVEYKVGEAWAVFEELQIPMDDRNSWIGAF
jgi:hypothetical protein